MRYVCLLTYLGYASYIVWFSFHYRAYAWLAVAALPLLAVIGLVLKRRWAWYAACASSLFAVGIWLYGTVMGLIYMPHATYPDVPTAVIGFLIASVWPIVWIAAGIVAYRVSRRPNIADIF